MISLSRPSGVNAPGSGRHAPAFLSPGSLLAGKGGLFGRRPRRADGALRRLLEEVIVTLRTEEEAWAIGRGWARDRPGQKEQLWPVRLETVETGDGSFYPTHWEAPPSVSPEGQGKAMCPLAVPEHHPRAFIPTHTHRL